MPALVLRLKTVSDDVEEKRYYLVIPLLAEGIVDRIISVLVKRGYFVGPLASSRKVYFGGDNNVVTLLALNVSRTHKKDEADAIGKTYDDVVDVLKTVKAKYLCVWLSDPVSNAHFNVGNVTRDPVEEKVNAGNKPPSGVN